MWPSLELCVLCVYEALVHDAAHAWASCILKLSFPPSPSGRRGVITYQLSQLKLCILASLSSARTARCDRSHSECLSSSSESCLLVAGHQQDSSLSMSQFKFHTAVLSVNLCSICLITGRFNVTAMAGLHFANTHFNPVLCLLMTCQTVGCGSQCH
jgi:hypothetical protein